MDKKVVIIAAIVVVIAVAAVAVIALNSNSGEKNYNLDDIKNKEQNTAIDGSATCYAYQYTNSGCKLLIYGNVNNDDNIDNYDLTRLKAIVSANNWDHTKNPFADVNCDGKVDNSDVTALEKIINKESTLLYYVNNSGYPEYIHYPITGKIGINYDYGYMSAQILGIWDRVSAGIDRWVGEKVTDTLYPGVHSLYNMGSEQTVENDLAAYQNAGVTIIMGSSKAALNNELHAAGWGMDYIDMSLNNVKYSDNILPVYRLVTLGFMFDKLDNALEYYNWWNSLNTKIADIFESAGLSEKSFVMPYNTTSATETYIDDRSSSGVAMGDYNTAESNLPLYGAITAGDSDYYEVEIETLYTLNPDVLIISMWGSLTDQTSYADAYNVFKTKADYFEKFDAYKNKQVYGVCYETFGTYAGVAAVYLLASYIYPDLFSEEDGWDYLEQYFEKFTLISDDVDLKNAGGLIVYQLGRTSP